MALDTYTFSDRVKESTATSGTGSYALGGALPGFFSFGSAFSNGAKIAYVVEGADSTGAAAAELARGTYNAGANTVTRDAILKSTNSNNPVNWLAGVEKTIFNVAPAALQLFLTLDDVLLIPRTVSGQYAPAAVNSGTALSPAYANVVRITLTGNATITLPAMAGGTDEAAMIVELVQDGTGGRTVTWASPGGTSIKWDSSATAPPINSAAGKETHVGFRRRADGTVYYGQVIWYEA